MRHPHRLLFAALSLAIALPAAAQAPTPDQKVVREEVGTRISENIDDATTAADNSVAVVAEMIMDAAAPAVMI